MTRHSLATMCDPYLNLFRRIILLAAGAYPHSRYWSLALGADRGATAGRRAHQGKA